MKHLFFFFILILSLNSTAQLSVVSGLTPAQYVDELVGVGVTYSNVSYTGDVNSIGLFSTGATPTNLGLDSGLIMSSGYVNGSGGQPAIGSPVSNFASSITTGGSDPQLQALIPGYTINDATFIEFDFIPESDTISFDFVFGSEEYPEWVGSSFNDVFGFFVSGPNPLGGAYTNYNIARLPGGLPVTIDNVNSGSNSAYYVDNEGINGQTIVYDGFTTVLTAWLVVTPCVQYHIKLAVGDAGDQSYDSGVFLRANSFSSPTIIASTQYVNDTVIGSFAMEAGCNDAMLCFSLANPSTNAFTVNYTIGGTATNGVDFPLLPDSLIIPAGFDSVCMTISPYGDGLAEGIEELIILLDNQLGCSSTSDTIIIQIMDYDFMNLVMSPDTTICGDSAFINAFPSMGFPPYNYNWDNALPALASHFVSPANTTTYTVTITDYCNQDITGDVTITVGNGFADLGPDIALCNGESATLTVNQGLSYLWNTGDTTQTITITPSNTGQYTVTVTDICVGSDSILVTVNPLPIVTADVDPDSICAGEEVELSASGADLYTWESTPTDVSLNDIPGEVNDLLFVTPGSNVTYSVTGTDINGCTGTADVYLVVSPIPVADFFTQPPVASSFDPLFHFYDNSLGNPIIWQWILEDGSMYNVPEFIHTFPKDEYGEYEVYLYVENAFGCSDTILSTVLVRPDYTLYIPNAFTPNKPDGHNDKFHISGINMPDDKFSIRIYDRYGTLVFVSSNPAFEWDGKMNGELLPQGTFVYRIFYQDPSGNNHVIMGNITLLH